MANSSKFLKRKYTRKELLELNKANITKTRARILMDKLERKTMNKPWWSHYSRYRVMKRGGDSWETGKWWSVETQDGEVIRRYPITRYDRALAFADKINHEEWDAAMKANRAKRKLAA